MFRRYDYISVFALVNNIKRNLQSTYTPDFSYPPVHVFFFTQSIFKTCFLCFDKNVLFINVTPECKIIKSFELIFNIYFVICNYEYKGRRMGLSDTDLQWNHARAITTMFYSSYCKKIKVTMDR